VISVNLPVSGGASKCHFLVYATIRVADSCSVSTSYFHVNIVVSGGVWKYT